MCGERHERGTDRRSAGDSVHPAVCSVSARAAGTPIAVPDFGQGAFLCSPPVRPRSGRMRGMERHGLTKEEVVRRGREIYEREIRAKVEPDHDGEFLVVDITTGSYEVAADGITAARRIRKRNPEALLCFLRVGHPTAYRIGAPLSIRTVR